MNRSTAPLAPMNRRTLLKVGLSATGGLCIGFPLIADAADLATVTDRDNSKELSAFLVIEKDAVIIRVPQAEMGQGTATGLALLLAEELECDWTQVRFEHASSNRNQREKNVYGRMQTVGSSGLRSCVKMMQLAGASARERLRLAAAQTWKVPAAECAVEAGKCLHRATNRSIAFAQLAPLAAQVNLTSEPALKKPSEYRLAGKWTARLDTPAKLDGSAQFGIDIKVPDMVYAAVSGCPVFGGTLQSVDDSALKDRRGIVSVIKLKDAVAVVADRYWRAKSAIDLLKIEWEAGPAATVQSAQLRQDLRDALNGELADYQKSGDVSTAFAADNTKLVEATYEAPFLSHSPMEPPNCTVQVAADRVDIWMGTQNPMSVIDVAAKLTGLPPENIYVHNTYLGGGFGRKYLTDELAQGVDIAKAVGKPVKLIWSREQDHFRGRYRPMAAVQFKAAVDSQGKATAFQARIAVHSIGRSLGMGGGMSGRPIEPMAVQTFNESAYAFPNKHVAVVMKNSHVPVTFWRSVGSSQNAFFLECFIDEMAHAASQDPYTFRRAMLSDSAWLRVLDVMAEKSDWKKPLGAGRGRGMAIVDDFESICGQVVEVTVGADGRVKVDRVVVVLDCGNVANQNTVVQQMESGVIFGLTAALYGEITIKDGAAVETNFHQYRMVTLADSPPRIEVHLALSGGDKWGGVGEAGLPPLAPALCNAIFAATGKRVRSLPLKNVDLSKT